jgi:hypothetical protein
MLMYIGVICFLLLLCKYDVYWRTDKKNAPNNRSKPEQGATAMTNTTTLKIKRRKLGH